MALRPALGPKTIQKTWTGGRACGLRGAAPSPLWVRATRSWACDCGLRKRALVAALSATQCRQEPAEPPRQRHGRRTVWLLVAQGRGPRGGGRPGHLGRSGECPQRVRPAGCPGAGQARPTPCPASRGRVLRERRALGKPACPWSCAVRARAFVCVYPWGSGCTRVSGCCVSVFLVPVLENVSVCPPACFLSVYCVYFLRAISKVCTTCMSACVFLMVSVCVRLSAYACVASVCTKRLHVRVGNSACKRKAHGGTCVHTCHCQHICQGPNTGTSPAPAPSICSC